MELSNFGAHFNINQTTAAVKKVDSAYTSASTALNHCESVIEKVSAAISPEK